MINQPHIDKLKQLRELLNKSVKTQFGAIDKSHYDEAMKSAIEQLEWRDMESAPKNGINVHILWVFKPTGSVGISIAVQAHDSGVWYWEHGGLVSFDNYKIISWRPRPTVPEVIDE